MMSKYLLKFNLLVTTILLVFTMLGVSNSSWAQSVGDFQTNGAVTFSSPANWQRWNGTTWVTPGAAPATTDGVVTIRNTHTATVGATITIDQLVVATGGILIISSGVTLTIADGAFTDLSVDGTVNNGGTITPQIGATILFNANSTYNHTRDSGTIPAATWNATSNCNITGVTANMVGGLNQTFGNFTWNCPSQVGNLYMESNITIAGNFTVSGTGTFSHTVNSLRMSNSGTGYTMTVSGNVFINANSTFKMSNNSGLCTLNVSGNLTLNGGNFTIATGTTNPVANVTGHVNISSGTFIMKEDGNAFTGTLNIGGNFTFSGGTITQLDGGGGSGSINFIGNTTHIYSKTGGTFVNTINFNVSSGSTLNVGTSLIDGSTGAFTLNSGAGIITAHAQGLSTTAGTGSIRVAGTKTYSTGANYTYNGTAAQVTGNGLPSTVSNLTISNATGVTLNAAKTITNNFSITSGSFVNLQAATHNTGTLTLGGIGTAPGSWGSTISSATNKNNTYFASTTGIINVVIPPTVTGALICTGATATLSASGATAGGKYKWYNAATGGTLLKTSLNNTDNTYTTTVLASTTNYWVSIFSAIGCESSRTQVTATINPTPAISPNKVDETCPDSNNGSITPVLSGGLSNVRYIKLTQKYINGDAWQQVQEIQAFEIFTGTNVALTSNGASATSSSDYSNDATTFGPQKAIDGDYTGYSFWHSNSTNVGEWVKVDLQSAKNIDYLRIYNRADCCQERGQNMLLELFDASNNLVYSKTIDLYQSGANVPVNVNVLDVSWADAATTLNRTALDSGTYTLNYADAVGCSVSSPINISSTNTVPLAPTLSAVTQPTCATATGSFTITNYNASYTYTVTPSTGVTQSGNTITAPEGSYTVTATFASCASPASVCAIINAQPANVWNGSNTDWNDPANWCSGVPTNGILPTLNVVIPSGLPNYPIIFAGDPAGYVKTLVLENNTTLNVRDNSLRVTENLKLDGKIDLEGESQLLQDLGSTLDPTSSGTLERDQQGTADTFTYNYWSSPVGLPNNTTNNNSYKLPDIFPGINFLTSGYNGTASPIGIADYWIWKFSNKVNNYSQWQHVRSTGTMLVGEGFTMKGPGTGSITTLQNYVLLGKPNNGDISLPINSGNSYLVGNPYPSAIDAHQFILDNGPVINQAGSTNGILYFWEHWGGGSHLLREYQGGYATYSLSGGIPAAALGTNDPMVGTGGIPTKTPGRYIPVGQGFFVSAETTGTIKFNNGQRIFKTEDGTNSLFIKSGNTKNSKSSNLSQSSDTRLKLRIGFYSVSTIRRQLLVTVDSNATIGYNWGYDAPYIDTQIEDMYWMIEDNKYSIQGVDQINEQTILPLGIHTKKEGLNSISMDLIENDSNNLNVYLHDKELNVYHDLKSTIYTVYLSAGNYFNRFEITFNKSSQILGTNEDAKDTPIEVYYSNEKNSIIIDNPISKYIKTVEMFNTLGQSMFKFETNTNSHYLEYNASQIKTGAYVLNIETEFGKLSKKVLVK